LGIEHRGKLMFLLLRLERTGALLVRNFVWPQGNTLPGAGTLLPPKNIYIFFGQPAMKLLHQLGDEAAGPGGITQASFVAGTLRELSVGLCRGNFLMYRASGGMFARLSGRGFRAGLAVPTDEAIE
jgi:hypothetical protein